MVGSNTGFVKTRKKKPKPGTQRRKNTLRDKRQPKEKYGE